VKTWRVESDSKAFFSCEVRFNLLTTIFDVPDVDKFVFWTSCDKLLSYTNIEASDFISMERSDQILESQFLRLLSLVICNFKICVDNLSLLRNSKDLVFCWGNDEALNIVISVSRESFFSSHLDLATVTNLESRHSLIVAVTFIEE
jgi:hypothetical protein